MTGFGLLEYDPGPEAIDECRDLIDQDYPGRWALLLVKLCSRKCDCGPSSRGKNPHPDGGGWNRRAVGRWNGNADRTAHVELMARWLEQGGNCGLVLPPGFIALDLDSPQQLANGVSAVPGAPRQTSREGRGHIVCRVPADRKVPNSVWIGNVPTLTRQGRQAQIACAPSIHFTEAVYQWLEPLPDEPDDVPWLPEAFYHAAPDARAVTRGEVRIGRVDWDREFRGAGQKVPRGSRYPYLVHVAGQLVADGAETVEAIEAGLYRALEADCEDPQGIEDRTPIARLAKDAATKFERPDRTADNIIDRAVAAKEAREKAERVEQILGSIVHYREIDRLPAAAESVKGLIPSEGQGFVLGPPNAGKTFLALDLAGCVASGRLFLGRVVKQPGLVVYIAAEGGLGIMRRVWAMRQEHGNGTDLPLVVIRGQVGPSEELAEQVRGWEKEYGVPVRLVIADTLAQISGGDENSGADMAPLIKEAQAFAAEAKCFWMWLAHPPKAEGGKRTVRGWSGMDGASDSTLRIEQASGDLRRVVLEKSRDGEAGQEFACLLRVVELGTDEDGDPITSRVVETASAEELNASKRGEDWGVPLRRLVEALTDCLSDPRRHEFDDKAERYQVGWENLKAYLERAYPEATPSTRRSWYNRGLAKGRSLGVLDCDEVYLWRIN